MPASARLRRHKDPLIVTAIILGFIIAGVITLTPWVWVDPRPKPLGEGLVYLGKRDYGCRILLCDQHPSSLYFYETDLSMEEVGKYFKEARLESSSLQERDPARGAAFDLNFQHINQPEAGFTLTYYEDGPTRGQTYNIPPVHKKHLVELGHRSYPTAVDVLR